MDAVGHRSARTAAVNVTTPGASSVVFTDGFESGTLADWTVTGAFAVEQTRVFAGSYAAGATATGTAAWAYRSLGTTYPDLYYRVHARIDSTTGNVYLLKLRTSTGASLLGLLVDSKGRLAYRNDVAGVTTTSTTPFSLGVWHDVQVHLAVGSPGQAEVWLDGAPVALLSTTQNFGTTPIGRVQLGDNSAGRTFTEYFDEVSAGTSFLP
jgi:hypothetical protein